MMFSITNLRPNQAKPTHQDIRLLWIRFVFKICLLIIPIALLSTKAATQDMCTDACDTPVPCYNVDLSAASDAYQFAYISGNGSCCDNIPVNQNCVEIKVQLASGAEGIQVSFDEGPNQCSINIYDGALGCPSPAAIDAAPSVCDPLCPVLEDGIATILLCKPGNFNEIGFGFTGIAAPGIVPSPIISEDCVVDMTAVNINDPIWSSPDDPSLAHLSNCASPGDTCGETVTFSYSGSPITECDGIIYHYEVSGLSGSACSIGNVTGYGEVHVYPILNIESVAATCSDPSTDELTLSPVLSGGAAQCSLIYEWTLAGTETVVGSEANLVLSPQDGQDYCVSVKRRSDIDACAVVTACATATATCCELSVTCPSDNLPIDENTFFYQCIDDVPACADDLDSFNALDLLSNINESCGPVTVVCQEESFGDPGLGCPNDIRRIQRTYTITDTDTDESVQCTTNLFVQDQTPPVLDGCPTEPLVLECGEDNTQAIDDWLAAVTAGDNCGAAIVNNSYEAEDLSAICEGEGLSVTFTATDACGNTASCEGEIRLLDTSPPSFDNCADVADLILECGDDNEDAIQEWLNSFTASDDCGSATVESDFDPQDLGSICAGDEGYTVTFTATDQCDLTAECTGLIYLYDTTPPSFDNCPESALVLECGDDNEQAINDWLAAVTASDNCGAANVNNSYVPEDLQSICAGEGLLVEFTASDACGTTASCVGEIRLLDTTPPGFDNCGEVADLILECSDNNEDAIQSWLDSFTASDECGSVTIGDDYSANDLNTICTGEAGYTVTFTARDNCGATSFCSGTIYLYDTKSPVLDDCPSEALILECGQDNEQAIDEWLSTVSATDLCSSFGVSNDYEEENLEVICPNAPAGAGLIVTFTAEDECGNSSTCQGEIRLQGSADPVLENCPVEPLILECGEDNQEMLANWLGSVTATGVCSPAVVDHDFDLDNLDVLCSIDQEGLTVTFEASDDCGNTASCTGVIKLLDTQSPGFDQELPPSPITVDCNDIPDAVVLTATDACQGALLVDLAELVTEGDCAGEYTISRTWTATDNCQNSVAHTQLVTVVNAGDPVFDQETPQDATVSCDDIPAPAILTATGICSQALVSFNEDESDEICAGSYTITRTWVAEDECGDRKQHQQVLTVQDTEAPQFDGDLPVSEIFQSCDLPVLPAAILTATDNCNPNVVVVFSEVIDQGEDDCPESYSVIRQWRVSDGCNQNVHNQVVYVSDDTAPELDLQVSFTFNTDPNSCGAADVVLDIPEPTDNCDQNPELELSRADGLPMNSEYPVGCTIVTATVTDNCGNSDSFDTQVCVVDNEFPIFLSCPEDIMSCSATASWDLPEVSDNCSAMITNVTADSGAEFPVGETEVVVTAMDDSGNTITCSFLVVRNPMVVEIISSDYNGYGVRCTGGSDGWLEAVTEGGFGEDRTYSWSNGMETAAIEDLPADVYTVLVVDEEGCTIQATTLVSEPQQMFVNEEIMDIRCPIDSYLDGVEGAGYYELSPTGGTGTYQYYWSSTYEEFEDPGTASINVLRAGTYYFTVTDGNNCYEVGQAEFTQPDPITISGDLDSMTDGFSGNILPVYYNALVIDVAGGSGDYIYDWDRSGYVRFDIDHDSDNSGEAVTIIYADDAEWVVTVTDMNGCSAETVFTNDSGSGGGNPSVSDQGTILDIDDFIITGQSYDGEVLGTIELTVVGGQEPYTYNWSGPGYSNGPDVNLHYITELDFGFYEVTVTDSGSPQQSTEGFYYVPLDRSSGRLKAQAADSEPQVVLDAFPNPFSESTNLSVWSGTEGNTSIELLDCQGKLIDVIHRTHLKAGELQRLELDAGTYNLRAGLYLLRLVGPDQSMSTIKLVIAD